MILLADFIEKSYLNILKSIENLERAEGTDPLIKRQKSSNNETESLLYDSCNNEMFLKKDSILNEIGNLKEIHGKKLYQNKKNKFNKINMIKHMIKGKFCTDV